LKDADAKAVNRAIAERLRERQVDADRVAKELAEVLAGLNRARTRREQELAFEKSASFL